MKSVMNAVNANPSLLEIHPRSKEYESLVEQFASKARARDQEHFDLGIRHGLGWASKSSYQDVYNWLQRVNQDEDWDCFDYPAGVATALDSIEDDRPFNSEEYFKGWRHGIRELCKEASKRHVKSIPAA